ncbi:MAG: M20/M25/M40 family metallo-hydrolase [Candidatus Bathyarchaeia archaeon]
MYQDEMYPLELLRGMLEIYSPSGKEDKIASYLADELKRAGFSRVWTDSVNNVYGEVGSAGPTILLCGHMDTVPGWIPVRVEGDRLYGRGSVDAKSSLAAMIISASSLKSSLSRGRILVACVVDEEGRARGIKRLVRDRPSIDYAIFGEPSGIKNVVFAYKGHLKIRIEFRTATGHVGAQHLLPNAIEKGFEFWSKLKERCEREYKSPYGIFYSLTPALTGISGRGTTRSIPDICTLEVDLRLPPTIKCGDAMKIIGGLIDDFRAENYGLASKLRIIDRVEPYVARRDTVVVKSLRDAILEVTGEEARLLRKTGTGDMNIFGAHYNVPVATYGPGDSSLSHTPNEYISITEYLASIEIYKRAVKKILDSSGVSKMAVGK